MNRGVKAALLVTGIGLAGCVAGPQEVKVRPIGNSTERLARAGDDLAVANGQLALGNVGLALEAYRAVQRDRPSDPRPLAGIAECYARMSRFDLAQSNYEAALALAPRDPALLLGLARVFELEGQPDRAVRVRREAQADAAGPVAPMPAPQLAATASVTVALPPARPADRIVAAAAAPAEPVRVAEAPAPSVPQPAVGAPEESEITPPARPFEPMPVETVSPAAQLAGLLLDRYSSAIPVKIPDSEDQNRAIPAPEAGTAMKSAPAAVELAAAPRTRLQEAELSRLAPSPDVAPPQERPAAPRPVEPPRDALAVQATGPRLERLSSHEVALVTTGLPEMQMPPRVQTTAPPRPQMIARTTLTSAVRWIPLVPQGSTPNVQVLNAARTQGLAASARAVLVDRGWRKISVGNAPAVRQASVVLYPRHRARLAKSLAAQFGIRTRMIGGTTLVLVLGRDKIGTVRPQRQL